jgi:hypothetical protein
MRVVPVGPDGTEYADADAAVGIVGNSDQEDIAAFLEAVSAASGALMSSRGV